MLIKLAALFQLIFRVLQNAYLAFCIFFITYILIIGTAMRFCTAPFRLCSASPRCGVKPMKPLWDSHLQGTNSIPWLGPLLLPAAQVLLCLHFWLPVSWLMWPKVVVGWAKCFGAFVPPRCPFWMSISWWVLRSSSNAVQGPTWNSCTFSMEWTQPVEDSANAPGLATMS